MTATLEELYHSMPDDGVSPEYEAARAAKVVEIAEYITPRIKHGVDPYRLAEQIVSDAEEQPKMEWQPIETAPRDGTYIMAIIKGISPQTGNPFIPNVVYWSEDEDDDFVGWCQCSCPDCCDMPFWEPTHWMPLPAPPSNLTN